MTDQPAALMLDAGAGDAETARPRVHARFTETAPVGAVDGPIVVDREGRISADHGALRLRPLAEPGWGREAIAYGPFRREPGLTLAVHVLNGHNASQTFYLPERPKQRLKRWLQDARRGRFRRPRHHENLAVGWYAEAAPRDPTHKGSGLIVRSATGLNGELWASGPDPARLVPALVNIPFVYVVALRERGAAYYAAATVPGGPLPLFPALRPLAISRCGDDSELYASLQQCILGEVNYRVDTRVHELVVADVARWSRWCGDADVADRLTGTGALAGSSSETGQRWDGSDTGLRRSAHGCTGVGSATVTATAPAGLIAAAVDTNGTNGDVTVRWRGEGDSGWTLRIDARGATLGLREHGRDVVIAATTEARLRRDATHDLQVADDGGSIAVRLNDRLVFQRWIADARMAHGREVGLALAGGAVVRDLEVHPRTVAAPVDLRSAKPWSPAARRTVLDDRLGGEAGDLDGQPAAHGGRWQRSVGSGVIVPRARGGAAVRATRAAPNPGRTIYTTEWDEPAGVDLAVEMTPPGSAAGEGHDGRGGLVLWQDEDNYLVVNIWLDDSFEGTSVSSFYMLDGHEDMYEAVWTNVGRRVRWGTRFTLRVVCDGERFTVSVDDEPVLHRAFSDVRPAVERLAIRRVGIAANWEWGDDTGTVFHRVTARSVEVSV